ncbi:MAG TPA: hypothetical protein VF278_12480, partial [Pirellulales bacterium]
RARLARAAIEQFRAGLARGLTADALAEHFLSSERSAAAVAIARVSLVDLPTEAADVIKRVIRLARLWPKERDDVREELAAHFRDGLDGGASPADMVASFGDVRSAARLIRRAKLRNRPAVYRAFRRACQVMAATTAAVLAVYLFLALRYYGASPNIRHNYIADVNADAVSVPPEDRAWPLYRAALLKLPKEKPDPAAFLAGPDGDGWPEVVSFLDANREVLTLARRAATKPHLGFVFGEPANRAFLARYSSGADTHGESPDRYQPQFIQVVLPHAQEMRTLLDLFRADAREAAARGNGNSVRRDVQAMLRMARHTREALPCLVAELMALAIQNGAIQSVFEALADKPAVFSDTDLKLLAHDFAANTGAGLPQVSLDGERMMIDDVLQRVFSDNGAGDGRLTSAGLDFLEFNESPNSVREAWLLGPVVSVLVAGRRETHDLAAQWFDHAEAEHRQPLWKWGPSSFEAELKSIAGGFPSRLRYLPLVLLMPAVESAFLVREIRTQEQDAVLTAIALELYHRRAKKWPATLAELTPGLLPAVPPDRFTGEPLCYRLVDGRPLIYSRGTDCDDDGGVLPKEGNRVARAWDAEARLDAQTVTTAWAAAHDGDWILWPPVRDAEK